VSAPEEDRLVNTVTERIVVGVNGSRASRQALLWGAHEAHLSRAELLVVHVVTPVADAVGIDADEQFADHLLTVSAEGAADLEPDVPVRMLRIVSDGVADRLVELSRSADLLVLGVDPTRTRASHGISGPLEDRLAVHAHCPVVTVAGTLASVANVYGRVVVGWTPGHTGHLALTAAADEAALAGAALTVFAVPAAVDPAIADIIHHPSPEPVLITAVTDVERRHVGLVIDITHGSGDPTSPLVDLSARADLLVVGCHHSERSWNIRSGPVAGTAMRTAHCPVMLVGRIAHSRHKSCCRRRPRRRRRGLTGLPAPAPSLLILAHAASWLARRPRRRRARATGTRSAPASAEDAGTAPVGALSGPCSADGTCQVSRLSRHVARDLQQTAEDLGPQFSRPSGFG
jgi:nucleotide-binding universal stress UspA family protein